MQKSAVNRADPDRKELKQHSMESLLYAHPAKTKIRTYEADGF